MNTARTYSIIKSKRDGRKENRSLVASGLSWEDADKRRDELQAIERRANPHLTSWTIALYLVELETDGRARP